MQVGERASLVASTVHHHHAAASAWHNDCSPVPAPPAETGWHLQLAPLPCACTSPATIIMSACRVVRIVSCPVQIQVPKWKLQASAKLTDPDPLKPPTTTMLSPSGLTTAECKCLADGPSAAPSPAALTRFHVFVPEPCKPQPRPNHAAAA